MESERRTKNELAIYERSKTCASLLNDCLSRSVLNQDEWASDQAASFKLWIEQIGAFAQYSASADARLNSTLDVKQAVIGLLDLLQLALRRTLDSVQLSSDSFKIPRKTLRKAYEIVESDEESLEFPEEDGSGLVNLGESPSSGSSMSLASQPTCDVEDLLMRLHQIVIAIRTSSTRHADAKAAAVKYEDEEDFTQFTSWYMDTIFRKDYPDAEDYLVARLCEANLKRRKHFEYARQHAKKLAEDRQVSKSYRQNTLQAKEQTTIAVPVTLETPIVTPQTAVMPTEQQDFGGTSVALSSTIFSAPVEAKRTISSIPVSERSGKTFVTGHVKWPQCPDASKNFRGAVSFSCPYCCKPLPASIRDQENRWREHVKADIQPYICLFKECQNAQQLYSTRQEWLKHMEQDHGRVQYLCHISAHKQGPMQFDTPEAYEKHMLHEHAKSFNAAQLPMLVEKSVYKTPLSPVFETCPICPGPDTTQQKDTFEPLSETERNNEYANKRSRISESRSSPHKFKSSSVKNEVQQSGKISNESGPQGLATHIMEHLQFIALLSLPWNAEQDSDRSKISGSEEGDLFASEGNQSQDLDENDVTDQQLIDPISTPTDYPTDPALRNNELVHGEWNFIDAWFDSDLTTSPNTDPILVNFVLRTAEHTTTALTSLLELLNSFIAGEKKYRQKLGLLSNDISSIRPDRVHNRLPQDYYNVNKLGYHSRELDTILSSQLMVFKSLEYTDRIAWAEALKSLVSYLVPHFNESEESYEKYVSMQKVTERKVGAARRHPDLQQGSLQYLIERGKFELTFEPCQRVRVYAFFLRRLRALMSAEGDEQDDLTRVARKFTSLSMQVGIYEYMMGLDEEKLLATRGGSSGKEIGEETASQQQLQPSILDPGTKEQSGRAAPSAENVRKLRELIKTRHHLDNYVWSLRGARRPDRPIVLEQAAQSDATLVEIRSIVDSWEPEHFTMEEWRVARKIKERLLENDKQIWEGSLPWDHH